MRQFKILDITTNAKSIAQIYSTVTNVVRPKQYLFEVHKYIPLKSCDSKPAELPAWDGLGIKQYSYEEKNETGIWYIASNLDDRWELCNPDPKLRKPLNRKAAAELVEEVEQLGKADYSNFMLICDCIQWADNEVSGKAYSYEKFKSAYSHGKGYLSNCINIYKKGDDKIGVFVCYELQYQDSVILQKVLKELGKIRTAQIMYAPQNEQERKEMVKRADTVKDNFTRAVKKIIFMCEKNKLPYPFVSYDVEMNKGGEAVLSTIAVRKTLDRVLSPKGWILQKNAAGEKGIKCVKTREGDELILWVEVFEKRNCVCTYLTYTNYFLEINDTDIGLDCCLEDEKAVEEYGQNLAAVLEYIEQELK